MKDKKILVICNTFPPAPGIGGRRWTKFSKYLTRNGYTVHVACAANLSGKISEWNPDVANNSSIHVHPYNFQLRKLLLLSKGLLARALRKTVVKLLRATKYSERFITSLPNSTVWQDILNLIKTEKIPIVIVSGDPFLFFYASKLKRRANFRLILDYRDLWTDHSFYTKYKWFTPAQFRFFRKAEELSLQHCNEVFTVDEHLRDIIAKKLPLASKDKIKVLHNGFDPEDFRWQPHNTVNQKKTLYFSGNLATDLNEIVLHFIDCFARLKKEMPHEYNKWEIHLKGKMDETLYAKLAGYNLENLVLRNDFVPLGQYYREISTIDIGIIVLSPEYAHSFTTKFSDYLYLDKKMLVLGSPGRISELLISNNNGAIFTLDNDHHFFLTLKELLGSRANYSDELKDRFNVNNLTEKLDQILHAS